MNKHGNRIFTGGGMEQLLIAEAARWVENFTITPDGLLDSTFRLMPVIPDQWQGGGGAQPAAFQRGVLGVFFWMREGEIPEAVIVTRPGGGTDDDNTALWRYAPWTRTTASTSTNRGIEPILTYHYESGVTTARPIKPAGRPFFPPQAVQVGNRLFITFCDGGPCYVFDGYRARTAGYSMPPAPPDAEGPQRGSSANSAGFSVRGRVGQAEGDWWLATTQEIVGGVDSFSRQYAVVFENVDGAYSPTSAPGGVVWMNSQVASTTTGPERLLRRFAVRVPRGPDGTTARVLLATANLKRLTPSDDGSFHVLERIPENESEEWYDDIPDGELGPFWQDRQAFPNAYVVAQLGGSVFYLRTRARPAGYWWTEQTSLLGPTPESILKGHDGDLYPETGPITGAATLPVGDKQALLVFKAAAIHYITGRYGEWETGTLREGAGAEGPGLVQVTPDGVLVYGQRTFWLCTPEGEVLDVGKGLKKLLKRVNLSAARYGVSVQRPEAGEVIFWLPTDGKVVNNVGFAWDYAIKQWRIYQHVAVACAATAPGSNLTWLGGDYDSKTTLWCWGRGYNGYAVTQPTSRILTGWAPFSDPEGPGQNVPANFNYAVFTMEERANSTATVTSYLDHDGDTAHAAGALVCYDPAYEPAPPDAPTVAFWGSATFGTSVWRDRRGYTQHVGVEGGGAVVFSLGITTTSPLAIWAVDVYGAAIGQAGARASVRPPKADTE
jgi:hypothetical protein